METKKITSIKNFMSKLKEAYAVLIVQKFTILE